jgi:hypothetical protein
MAYFKTVTGLVQLVYISLKEKTAAPGSDVKKYNVCVLVDKNDEYSLNKLEEAYNQAVEEGKQSLWKGKKPVELTFAKNIKWGPDEKDADFYQDKWYFNPKTDYEVPVIDQENNEISYDDCYDGMLARVSVIAYPFSHPSGGKGVGWILRGIQFWPGGEKIDVGTDIKSDFSNENDDFVPPGGETESKERKSKFI